MQLEQKHTITVLLLYLRKQLKGKKFVDTFQFYDSDNSSDSLGWDKDITEDDVLPRAFGTAAGIVFNSIYYGG